MIPKPTTKKDKANRRKAIEDYRKSEMKRAWYLDHQTNVSPLHSFWKKEFGKTWEWAFCDPPHHINGRRDGGAYDSIDWLITLNRLEHTMAEDGCKPLKLTGIEYMYLILWLLNGKPNNRWDCARALLGRKITSKRMREIMELAETLV